MSTVSKCNKCGKIRTKEEVFYDGLQLYAYPTKGNTFLEESKDNDFDCCSDCFMKLVNMFREFVSNEEYMSYEVDPSGVEPLLPLLHENMDAEVIWTKEEKQQIVSSMFGSCETCLDNNSCKSCSKRN